MGELAAPGRPALDELGLEVGDRVAVVSHNSARLLTSFFGVSGWGRVLVPVNFRLSPEGGALSSSTPAPACSQGPGAQERSSRRSRRRVSCSATTSTCTRQPLTTGRAAAPGRERHWACINHTSGTTAHLRACRSPTANIWVNAVTFGLHAQTSDRDVYLHTLPMFHANGWGWPFPRDRRRRQARRDPQDRRRRDPAPGRGAG